MKQLPEYLEPYIRTKQEQFEQLRDIALARRSSEVGRTEASKETGWSLSTVNIACDKHGVEKGKPGRKKKQQKPVSIGNPSTFPRFQPSQIPSEIADFSEPTNSTEIGKREYQDPLPKTRLYKNRTDKKSPLPAGCSVDQPDILPENSSKLQLSRGLFAIVDTDMMEDLSRFTWSAQPDGRTVYAMTRDRYNTTIRLHKHVLRINNGGKHIIDHINGNGLDNRRCNLRVVSAHENQMNRADKPMRPKSRFKGVIMGTACGWSSYIKQEGTYLKKNFKTELEAALHYDKAIVELRGPDAETNLTLGLYTSEELALITEKSK